MGAPYASPHRALTHATPAQLASSVVGVLDSYENRAQGIADFVEAFELEVFDTRHVAAGDPMVRGGARCGGAGRSCAQGVLGSVCGTSACGGCVRACVRARSVRTPMNTVTDPSLREHACVHAPRGLREALPVPARVQSLLPLVFCCSS